MKNIFKLIGILILTVMLNSFTVDKSEEIEVKNQKVEVTVKGKLHADRLSFNTEDVASLSQIATEMERANDITDSMVLEIIPLIQQFKAYMNTPRDNIAIGLKYFTNQQFRMQIEQLTTFKYTAAVIILIICSLIFIGTIFSIHKGMRIAAILTGISAVATVPFLYGLYYINMFLSNYDLLILKEILKLSG
jgi:hypothetical protein